MAETRECFEAKLATQILDNPHLFPAVEKLSGLIVGLLKNSVNQAFLKSTSVVKDEIINQLYSNTHYGVLGPALFHCPSQEHFIQTVIDVLSSPHTDLAKVLHIHQIFMQVLYDILPEKNNLNWQAEKKELVKKIFQNELFNSTSRVKTGGEGFMTDKVGYADECSAAGNTQTHRNIRGVFKVKADSYWESIIRTYRLPFLAGPSGHMGSGLLLAFLVGNFSGEELKQYVTANIGILTGGGFHTVDEIMSVASKVGLPYSMGQYHHFLPKNFLTSLCIAKLEEEFPEYVSSSVCRKFIEIKATEFFSSTICAATHGAIKGATNAVEKLVLANGANKTNASIVRQALYFSGIFTLQYVMSPQATFQALIQAAIDTGQLVLIESALNYTTSLIEKAQQKYKHDHPWLSKSATVCNGIISSGLFYKYAADKGLPQLAAVGAAGTLARVGVEQTLQFIGKNLGKY